MSQDAVMEVRQLQDKHDNLLHTLIEKTNSCKTDEIHLRNYQSILTTYIKVCQMLFKQTCNGPLMLKQVHVIVSTPLFQNLDMLFENVLQSCTEHANICNKKSMMFLQTLIELLNLLGGFSEQLVHNFEQLETIDIFNDTFSLPQSVLHIIYLSYEHCHSSEACYGDNFSCLSELLGELFRKTFGLQKTFTSILTKIPPPLRDESLVKSYNKVCHLLLDIIKIVIDMDSTLIGATWKLLLCFLCRCKPLLLGNITMEPFLREVIKNGETFSDRCNTTASDILTGDIEFLKSITLSTRMTAFFVGALANILTEYYPSMDEETVGIVVDFLFNLLKNLECSVVVIPGNAMECPPMFFRKIISGYFVKELDKCVGLLAHTKCFQDQMFNYDKTEHDNVLAKTLLNLRLVKCLNETHTDLDATGIDSHKIFTQFFQLQNKLYPYLIQSARCYFDENTGETPLLCELISRSLCTCLSLVPKAKFHSVENEILQSVTSSNPYNFLLSADLCCCIMRSLSDDAALLYVTLFIRILEDAELLNLCSMHYQLGTLSSRLFKLLQPDQQRSLLSNYPLSSDDNHAVWYFLGVDFLNSALDQQSIFDQATSILSRTTQSWLQKGNALSDLPTLISVLRVVTNIIKYVSTNDTKVSMQNKTTSTCSLLLTRLWRSLPSTSKEATGALLTLFTDLARVTSCFIHMSFDQNVVTEIFHSINIALLQSSPDCVNCSLAHSCVEMLFTLRHTVLSQELQNEVTSLWRSVLSHSLLPSCGWLLRFKCVEGFEIFSQVTKHPDVVRRICSKETDSQVRELVKSHFKRDLEPLPSDVNLTDILVLNHLNSEIQFGCEVQRTVENVAAAVRKLENLSPKTISENERNSLEKSINLIQNVLSSV